MADKYIKDRYKKAKKRKSNQERYIELEQNRVHRQIVREDEERREVEQKANTARRREMREVNERREMEQEANTARRKQMREDNEMREAEQEANTARRKQIRKDNERREAEQEVNTVRRREMREVNEWREAEQETNTARRKLARNAKLSTYEKALATFRGRNREGPVHICSCCGGLFFQKSVTTTSRETLWKSGCTEMFLTQVIALKPAGKSSIILCSTCRENIHKMTVNCSLKISTKWKTMVITTLCNLKW
jgi:hypothetical protein